MSQTITEPIDAVVIWVDGNDPYHAEKRTKALRDEGLITSDQLPTGHHKTRFIDNGELEWCIKSIRKFAPWIRNIYLVTDNQIPAFLNRQAQKNFKVKVVDHTEIFKSYEWALPTFNTRSIESVLWRIPGLSEKFIYFNDDFVLTAPLTKEHFFKGRKVVVRGNWRKITHYGNFRLKLNHLFSKVIKKLLGITRSMHLLLQIRSAQLSGFKKRYFYVPHVPHPVKKIYPRELFQEQSTAV
ncbi:stealth family protein [Rhodohalobacter halophilus]|uniref:stealth family protein n=1 Tax=Rhodohalobacter halophilus TaxID=1812810 RepID=UPI00083FD5F8|nr:Stealth CR1 domain-containing protein [Rhodohalobacter halophilus]